MSLSFIANDYEIGGTFFQTVNLIKDLERLRNFNDSSVNSMIISTWLTLKLTILLALLCET